LVRDVLVRGPEVGVLVRGPESLSHQKNGADAAGAEPPDMISVLIMDIGRGHHGYGPVGYRGIVQSFLNSNSGMIRIHLDDATRERLRDLRRKAIPPKARDRIEMLTLADAGWSAPRIQAEAAVGPSVGT
jgi:hypothetical protein